MHATKERAKDVGTGFVWLGRFIMIGLMIALLTGFAYHPEEQDAYTMDDLGSLETYHG